MFLRIKPTEKEFFRLFEEGADILQQGASLLEDLVADYERLEERLPELIEVEHRGDEVTEKIIEKLNQTFITPFDREDIYTLARELDEILDSICSAAEKMVIYRTGKPSSHFLDLVHNFAVSTKYIQKAMGLLQEVKENYCEIMDCFREIKRLETEGDKIYRYGVAAFFHDQADPLEVIKWKEVFDQLETALDRCEKIGKVIRGVAVKYA